GDARRDPAKLPRIAFPEAANLVAVLAVPFGPARRKLADLIPAGPDIPRLADQLHVRERRVLHDRVEEAAPRIEAVRLAAEDRAEIEAKPVDVHLEHPVAQRVHDHLKHA